MGWIKDFYRSSLGKKALMATSGIVLFGFVFVHMVGNLKMYLGAEAFNHYAAGLRELGAPFFPYGSLLWIARAVLLGAVVVHMVAAWQVWRQAKTARGNDPYRKHTWIQADYAVRTMRWGGVIILLFIVYHLLHLTFGTVQEGFQHPTPVGDGTFVYHAYENLVHGFSGHPLIALFYILANLALGLHLYHGVWSLFQTLGANHPRYNAWRRGFAVAFAFLVTAGNISFPIAVLTGLVK